MKEVPQSGTIRTACIVVPTYNESANITVLLDRIFANAQQHSGKGVAISVLVVDDSSPDGTAAIVREYAKRNANVHLLLREEKAGLGAAYIAGLTHAMETLEPDVLFEMDADLSHDPEYIFIMLEEVQRGADFVIGSRYVAGGSIPENWGAHRKLISKAANMYARTVLTLADVHDCTSGFRAIRASTLRQIDFSQLSVKGYAFQVSLLDAAIRSGANVTEIPIAFIDRTRGASKMRLKDVTEGGLLVLRMRAQRFISPHTGLREHYTTDKRPQAYTE